MTAPLLNEYKLRFALKRLFSTGTGCLLMGSSKASVLHSVILHSLQSFLFFLPFCIAGLCYLLGESLEWGSAANIGLGGTHVSRNERSVLLTKRASKKVCLGSLVGLLQAFVSAIHYQSIRHSQRKIVDSSPKKTPAKRNMASWDSDDGLMDLDPEKPLWACFEYLFIQSTDLPKGHLLWTRVLLNGILTGFLQAACSAYLSPKGWLALQFTGPLAWTLFVLGWYSVCVTQMSLTRFAFCSLIK